MRRLISVLILISISASLFAGNPEGEQKDDFGIWQYTTASKTINDKWSVFLRLEHRSKNNAQDLDCGLFMPGVTYKALPWLQLGYIYDFAMAQNNAHRNVMLPYITFSRKIGDWSLSLREMGQYIIESENFLLRTKLDIRYKIPGTKITPFVALEPYTNKNQVTDTDCQNFFKDLGEDLGVVKSSNFVGIAFSLGKRSSCEAGYCYYYLGANAPGRHLVNVGYTIRL